jgi:hypothetical protein
MNRICWLALLSLGTLATTSPRSVAEDAQSSGKGTVITLDGLQSRTPADWVAEPTGSRMRAYQFRMPRVEGDSSDAELIIFFFGPGGGGSAKQNVERWKGMFVPPDGKSIDDVTKIEEFKVGEVPVTYVDVHGTYKFKAQPFNPNAKEELRPDSRMVAVVFESAKGPYFMRLVGPAKTVSQHKKGFDEWLKGFK